MATACEITLMGGFGVRVDRRPTGDWSHRRAAELVKLLALADRHRLHREQIMDALWPDLAPEAAAANLRKAVHFARRAFGSDDSLAGTTDAIELWPNGHVTIDAEIFVDGALSALESGDETECARAAALWTGELLPDDRYASWAEEPRERIRLLAIRVLKGAAQWERVLGIDPADEEAHRALMRGALDAGDRSAALHQFERLRKRLRIDMGMGPDRRSVELYETALAMGGKEPPTPAEQARGLLAWGLVHLNTGDFDEAERTAAQARSLAIEWNLGKELGEASALLGILANMRGRWKEVFRAEFVDSVQRSPDMSSFVFDAHLCLAEYCLSGSESNNEIIAYARELLEVAEGAESVQGRALALLLFGEAELFSDRLDEAERYLETSLRLHEQAGAISGQAITLQRLAEVARAGGDSGRARSLLERGLRFSENSALAPHLVVRMHGGLVGAEEAVPARVERVEHADVSLSSATVCPPCSMEFKVAATIALADGARVEQARKRLDEAERIAGMWPGGPWHAAVWEARGFVRLAEGDDGRAAALFKEAAERFSQVGRTRDAKRCLDRVVKRG